MSEQLKKSRTSQNDLTKGSVRDGLLHFMWPIILGNLFTQLYNMVDSIIVGQFVGGEAMAAVGSSFSLTMMIYAFCIAIGSGAMIVISQYYGAHDIEKENQAANTGMVMALIMGVSITIVFGLLARSLLELLNTPENIIEDAYIYYLIIILGTVGHLYYQMGSCLLRGLGDSVWPLGLLIFCSLFNMAGDLLLVVVFDMGVAGAALATIVAQLVSGIAVIFRLRSGKYGLTINLKTLRINGQIAKRMLKIGIPAGLQQLVISSGSSVIQSFTNSFGSTVVAAQSAVIKIDGFITLPMMAIGMAVQTFVGQNVGARREDRIHEGVRLSLKMSISISIILGILLILLSNPFVSLFTTDTEIVRIGAIGLRILGLFYVFMGIEQVITGVARGAGDSIPPMIVSFLNIGVRIIIGYLLAIKGVAVYNGEAYRGLWYAMDASNVLSAVLMIVYYRSGRWRRIAFGRDEMQHTPVSETAETENGI